MDEGSLVEFLAFEVEKSFPRPAVDCSKSKTFFLIAVHNKTLAVRIVEEQDCQNLLHVKSCKGG